MQAVWRGIAFVAGMSSVACGMGSPAAPTLASAGGGSVATSVAAVADSPSCLIALHAILRDTATSAVLGQVQFRIRPGEAGEDPVLSYFGVFGPAGALEYQSLQSSIVARVPDQTPTWTDTQKADPGTPATEIIQFGRASSVNPELVAALIDDASRFKAVVNVVGVSGGQEAEGLVAPEQREPESLRDRRRTCFGIV